MNIPWYEDAAAQFVAGVAIAFTDRTFSGNAKRNTKERIENKLNQVASLQYIADAQINQNVSEFESSKEYFNAVIESKNYFINKGVYCKTPNHSGVVGLIEKVSEKIGNYRNTERVNNLPAGQKLAFATGIEVLGDALMGISHITLGVGNGVAALGRSIYQIPALYLGLQTGKGALYIKDFMFRSKEEKNLDSMATELTADEKLLELVRNYSPTAAIAHALPEAGKADSSIKVGISIEKRIGSAGNALADGAETVYEGVGSGINAIKAKIKQRIEEKAAKQEKRKKDLSGKYDKY